MKFEVHVSQPDYWLPGLDPRHTEAYFFLRKYGFKKGDFPVSESVSASTLSLPFYTGMKKETVSKVCEILKKTLK